MSKVSKFSPITVKEFGEKSLSGKTIRVKLSQTVTTTYTPDGTGNNVLGLGLRNKLVQQGKIAAGAPIDHQNERTCTEFVEPGVLKVGEVIPGRIVRVRSNTPLWAGQDAEPNTGKYYGAFYSETAMEDIIFENLSSDEVMYDALINRFEGLKPAEQAAPAQRKATASDLTHA